LVISPLLHFLRIITRPGGFFFILAFWTGLLSFIPDPAKAQHHLYFPLISNQYCAKDLVFLAFGDSITTASWIPPCAPSPNAGIRNGSTTG